MEKARKKTNFWKGFLLMGVLMIAAFLLAGCTQPLQSKIENCPPGKAAYVCGHSANISSYPNGTELAYYCRPILSVGDWSDDGYPRDGVGCMRKGLRCCWTENP